MKDILKIVAAIIFVLLLGYGGWTLERSINYKWSYQDQVQTEIQKAIKPLNDRITALEFQVKTNH